MHFSPICISYHPQILRFFTTNLTLLPKFVLRNSDLFNIRFIFFLWMEEMLFHTHPEREAWPWQPIHGRTGGLPSTLHLPPLGLRGDIPAAARNWRSWDLHVRPPPLPRGQAAGCQARSPGATLTSCCFHPGSQPGSARGTMLLFAEKRAERD